MFSASSRASSPPDPRAALEAALAVVAEESFFALLEPADPEWRAGCTDTRWLEAAVAFHGAAEGVVSCRLPLPLATSLAAAFLGMTEEEVTASAGALKDMTGELANMVCGCWLTRAFPSKLFQLEQPIIVETGEAPPESWIVVAVNGQPLGITIFLVD